MADATSTKSSMWTSTDQEQQAPAYEKRVLVTGGAGFIGSHVVTHLVKRYPQYYIVNLDSLDYCSCVHNVHTAISRPASPNVDTAGGSGGDTVPVAVGAIIDDQDEDLEEDDDVATRLRGSFCEWDQLDAASELRARLPRNYKFIKGSILSADLVAYVLQTEQIDTIMHFAAQSHVDNSFGNSIAFSQTNILGTHVLLEAARVHGKIQRFVHVSTDEVYGEGAAETPAMTEDHVLEPTNPYAASKAGAEFLVKAYQRSFKLPTVITRSNNVYGPQQYPEKLIPKFINQLARGRPVTIHGASGQHTRNYLYISDVVAAFDIVLHKGEIGHVYNIGGSNEVSNRQVALDLLKIMKPNIVAGETDQHPLISYVSDRPFNDFRYTIDAAKLRALGWEEKVLWQDGLRRTVKWYARFGHRFANIDQALEAHPIAFKKTYAVTDL
ncbi:Dtdp-glucose 4,6-dehydratase [Globisporangium polare]